MASSRRVSAAPQRSTAPLSSVGDSSRTSASIVSRSQSRSRRQNSRSRIIEDMLPPLIVAAALLTAPQQTPVPRPFPGARAPQPPPTQPAQPPASPTQAPPQPAARTPAAAEAAPTEAQLGVP